MCKRLTYKKISIPILVGLLTFTGQACRNDIQPAIAGPPLPVVYALLSVTDSVHQIKITRTFSGFFPAAETAANPDSLYYQEAEVNLEIRNREGFVLSRHPFKPILGQPKDSGLFVTAPNYIYQATIPDLPCSQDQQVMAVLTAWIPDDRVSVYSETIIPEIPHGYLSGNLLKRNEIDLYRANYIQMSGHARYFTELEIEVVYFETTDQGSWRKNFVYRRGYGKVSPPDAPVKDLINLDHEFLFALLARLIEDDPAVRGRSFSHINIRTTWVDQPWYDYYSAVYFAADVNPRQYSNIVNGLGVFAASNTFSRDHLQLDAASYDSLLTNKLTKHLKFWNR